MLEKIAEDLAKTYYFDYKYMKAHPEEELPPEFYVSILENVFNILRQDGVDCEKHFQKIYKDETI